MSSTDTSITGKRAEPERSNGKTADGESESHKLKHQRTKACHNLLRKTTARQLLESKSRKVIVLPHNKTVGEALHELSRHKITAAPVILQASLEDGEADTYMGIVDVRSILFHLMQDVLREEEEEKKKGVVTKSERVELLVKLGKRFVDRLLLTVSGNDTEFLLRGALDASLEEVICNGFFVHRKGETNKEHFPHVHRVTVFDMHGFVKGLISQSDIVRYLARHIGELGSIASTPLSELGITRSPVVTVLSTQTAMDALHVMHAKNVPAVAVVDGDGVLLANFSASDLTGMTAGEFALLDLPVTEFLVHEKLHSGVERDLAQLLKCYCCTPETTYSAVLKHLVSRTHGRIHRLYVVDGKGHPVGVVSMGDVLEVIASSSVGAE